MRISDGGLKEVERLTAGNLLPNRKPKSAFRN
jgi:hypothetical protein